LWFFEELSRPEGVQILRYAARAIELAGDIAGVQLEEGFVERLALAPSNVECFKTGAEVYRQLVAPAQVSLEQVTAHYAISSLFNSHPKEHRVYCYAIHQFDYQLQRLGPLTLATGHLQITSEITREVNHLVFGVLHLGGWDFHCCVQPFTGRRHYSHLKEQLFNSLHQASAAHTIGEMNHLFSSGSRIQPHSYSLRNLFAEERYRIMQLLAQETLGRLNHLYTQVYRDNYSVLMAFQRDEMEVPHELQVAAEIALEQRVIQTLQVLEQELSDLAVALSPHAQSALNELDAIAAEAQRLHCRLDHAKARQSYERLIGRSLYQLLYNLEPAQIDPAIACLEHLINSGEQLHQHLALDYAQELVYFQLPSLMLGVINETISVSQAQQILHLAQKLRLDVHLWQQELA
jgi:alpha-amylase/alpha-mannosidase (GH57 family)